MSIVLFEQTGFISLNQKWYIYSTKELKGNVLYNFYLTEFKTAAWRNQIKIFEKGFLEHVILTEVKRIP